MLLKLAGILISAVRQPLAASVKNIYLDMSTMLRPNPKLNTTDHNTGVEYAQIAAKMLREIGNAMDAPYVKQVAGISLLILNIVQAGHLLFS